MNKKCMGLSVLILLSVFLWTGCNGTSNSESAANGSKANEEKKQESAKLRKKPFSPPNLTYQDKQLKTDLPIGSITDKKSKSKISDATKILKETECASSMLIMHRGKLVKEEYFGINDQNDAQNIFSVSKSILSSLVGVALEKGYIKDVNDSISLYLPAEYFSGENASKKAITIKSLINMTSGFEQSEDWEKKISASRTDWVKAILEQKLIHQPGEVFDYNDANAQILAEIVARATGMDLKTFGDKYLFDKLGITVDYWYQDPQGFYTGASDIFITPYEMAKIGQLYLDKGKWKGEQIIPEKWVDDSVKEALDAHWGKDMYYGYCWWKTEMGGHKVYSASGSLGQYIHVVSDLDLVMVTTTNSNKESAVKDGGLASLEVLKNYIIPAFEKTK